MSWDIYIIKFDGKPTLEALEAEDFKPLPMGTAEDVRKCISAQWPQTDWDDPDWGSYESNRLSIEFNLGNGIINDLMLHIRGSGDPTPSIVSVCRQNGWTAMDGDAFLDEASNKSWQDWQRFRDQVAVNIQNSNNSGDG